MLKPDSVNFNKINIYDFGTRKNQINFASKYLDNNSINNLSAMNNDFGVKVPTSYSKTGIINLPYGFNAHCYKLANGQRVVILPKDGPTVVKTYVGTGSMNEPDNLRGISHYIEHNLFNGSDGLEAGEFFQNVNKMGAEANASTSFAVTDYYIKSNLLKDDDLETKIKMHASMLESPKFLPEMLTKEKGIVNSEINMYLGYPDNLAVNETLKKLYNINTSSPDLVAGTVQNINNLTREDVVDYFNNNYYPANMVTVITGEVEPDKTMQLISKYFSAENKNTHIRNYETFKPIDKTIRQDFVNDQATGTYIVMGFNGFENSNVKDDICMSMLNMVLNRSKTGRLERELKKYNTSCSLSCENLSMRPNDNCPILFNVVTSENNCEDVLQVMYNEIFSLTQIPVNNQELNNIKKSLLKKYSDKYENSARLNNFIGSNILAGTVDKITEYENIVNSITPYDLINAARKYLDLNKTVITVVHPSDKTQSGNVSFCGNIEKNAINPDNVKKYIFANNVNLVTNDIKTDSASLNISLITDKKFNVNPAAVFILDGLLNEGSAFRNDFEYAQDKQNNCITTGFSASDNSICANLKFNANDMDKALLMAREVIENPRFTQESFDFVKSQIIENISLSEKSAYDKLLKVILPDDYASCTREELLKYLESVSIDDVKKLYFEIINNSQADVVVSAPFNRSPNLQNTLFYRLAQMKQFEPNRRFLHDTYFPISETKVLTETYEKSQAQILETFKFRVNGNMKDKVSLMLMNEILGGNSSSRLFNDLREKQQLAYHVDSELDFIDNVGLLTMNIGTTTDNKSHGEISYDNVEKSINGFNNHIKKITTEKVSEEELEAAKLSLKNNILSGCEVNSSKNYILANGLRNFYGALSINDVLKTIDTISVNDIYNTAKFVFAGKPTYSILATEDTITANKEFLNSLCQ